MKQIPEESFKAHYCTYLFFLIISLVSCSSETNKNTDVIIDDPYINSPLKGQKVAVGYFKLSNHLNNTYRWDLEFTYNFWIKVIAQDYV